MSAPPMQSENDSLDAVVRRLQAIDWDFPLSRSESPFSDLHWHPCRFPSQVAAAAIGLLSPAGGLVLDPFGGSGTTAVEAQLLGRRSISLDLNPVSVLIAKAKTLSRNAEEVARLVGSLTAKATRAINLPPKRGFPESVQVKKWYAPGTASQLLKIFGSIPEEDGAERTIAIFCFSSILVSACSETRHWGYICDNTQPKEAIEADAIRLYVQALNQVKDAYRTREKLFPSRSPSVLEIPSALVINKNILQSEQDLMGYLIDCVVTSPPYYGVADYVKSQRLTLEWLGIDLEEYRRNEIGARSKRHRLTSRTDYIREILQAFRVANKPLKVGGYCLVIYGESATRESCLPEIEAGMAELGLMREIKVERAISTLRRLMPSVLYEHVILYRKA